MTISSRTPEGDPNRCPVCGHKCKIEPACTTSRDAPCPRCGHLLWFAGLEAPVVPAVETPFVWPYAWPSFVLTVAELPTEFFTRFRAPTAPKIGRPRPPREPALQAARLRERLLRRGTMKFGSPWFWQRRKLQQIQDPRAVERLLSLLHEARSWRTLLAAWELEKVSSQVTS